MTTQAIGCALMFGIGIGLVLGAHNIAAAARFEQVKR